MSQLASYQRQAVKFCYASALLCCATTLQCDLLSACHRLVPRYWNKTLFRQGLLFRSQCLGPNSGPTHGRTWTDPESYADVRVNSTDGSVISVDLEGNCRLGPKIPLDSKWKTYSGYMISQDLTTNQGQRYVIPVDPTTRHSESRYPGVYMRISGEKR